MPTRSRASARTASSPIRTARPRSSSSRSSRCTTRPRSSASWSPPISRCRAPARRRWTSCSRRPRRVYHARRDRARRSSPSASPSTSSRRSTSFMEDGFTKEEWKMVVETKKILDPKIKLIATCVRVPVFIGHSEAVNIEFENPITRRRGARDPAQGAGLPRHRQARARRLRHAVRGGGRGRDLYQPHPRGPDGRERPRPVVRLRQSAQGRRAQRRADRRMPGQPQADRRQAQGGVRIALTAGQPSTARSTSNPQLCLP